MAAHFAARAPYATWDPATLADYCQYGLLPSDEGDGFVLACPPRLEASIYQNSMGTSPYGWTDRIKARTTIVRAPARERKGHMDFSSSPTWQGTAQKLRAQADILRPDNSHFIPMESPVETAALLADICAQEGLATE